MNVTFSVMWCSHLLLFVFSTSRGLRDSKEIYILGLETLLLFLNLSFFFPPVLYYTGKIHEITSFKVEKYTENMASCCHSSYPIVIYND